MKEGQGFEPRRPLQACHISSAVQSTTLPTLSCPIANNSLIVNGIGVNVATSIVTDTARPSPCPARPTGAGHAGGPAFATSQAALVAARVEITRRTLYEGAAKLSQVARYPNRAPSTLISAHLHGELPGTIGETGHRNTDIPTRSNRSRRLCNAGAASCTHLLAAGLSSPAPVWQDDSASM